MLAKACACVRYASQRERLSDVFFHCYSRNPYQRPSAHESAREAGDPIANQLNADEEQEHSHDHGVVPG